MDSKSNYRINLIKSKKQKILPFFLFKTCILLNFIPSLLSNLINIKLFQIKEGTIPIIKKLENKRGCPTKMTEAETKIVHNDEDKCHPYIFEGPQNFNIEWDDNFEDCSNMF